MTQETLKSLNSGCLFGNWLSWRLNAACALNRKSLEKSSSVLQPHRKASNPWEHRGLSWPLTSLWRNQCRLLKYYCIYNPGPLNIAAKSIRNNSCRSGMLQPLTGAINWADHICLAAVKRGQWTLTPQATGAIVRACSALLCASDTWTASLGIRWLFKEQSDIIVQDL